MKKLLLFSVVLLTYTLGNAQNGTLKSTTTSGSATSDKISTKSELKVSSSQKSTNDKAPFNAIQLNKEGHKLSEADRRSNPSLLKSTNNVQPLERK